MRGASRESLSSNLHTPRGGFIVSVCFSYEKAAGRRGWQGAHRARGFGAPRGVAADTHSTFVSAERLGNVMNFLLGAAKRQIAVRFWLGFSVAAPDRGTSWRGKASERGGSGWVSLWRATDRGTS